MVGDRLSGCGTICCVSLVVCFFKVVCLVKVAFNVDMSEVGVYVSSVAILLIMAETEDSGGGSGEGHS